MPLQLPRDYNQHLEPWARELGLLPVPLYSERLVEASKFVLLNGATGNFCLDISQNETLGREGRNRAWSANVSHYLSLRDKVIEVQRWDQKESSIERYTLSSIYKDLERFHAYLEASAPRQSTSIVTHTLQIFRNLRALLYKEDEGVHALRAFLYLVQSVTPGHQGKEQVWQPPEGTLDAVNSISKEDWTTLKTKLVKGRPIERLIPDFTLMLRHAAGVLFQEAHREVTLYDQEHLKLQGFLPSPRSVSAEAKGVGIHFTPPALARNLVEEVFANLEDGSSLTVFDPACGSGEFLRETLRYLELIGYSGTIKLIGWDISRAACDMARFILDWEAAFVSAPITIDIENRDSLDVEHVWPDAADLILMNPPFVSWQAMSTTQRTKVRDALGALAQMRTDMSEAFVWKAANCVRPGGVLGCFIPASMLDSKAAELLRERLGQLLSPKLIARLGSHSLFSDATIDAALYVGKKDTVTEADSQGSPPLPISFWADHRLTSNSAGLRALRKRRYYREASIFPIIGDGFSIYPNPEIGEGPNSWAPRPFEAWNSLKKLEAGKKVKDIFHVRQGVRTGQKRTFLLTRDDWLALPTAERRFFRPAVVSKSIRFCRLNQTHFVFYPYGAASIQTEEELIDQLPAYFEKYLKPNRARLIMRARVDSERWWFLSEHRTWQVEPQPRIVSKYFGNPGSFAWDGLGEYVVVQGYAWSPKQIARGREWTNDLGLAYIAVLNSEFFFDLVSAVSNHVGGGQWNLSTKYVENLPIPDLFDGSIEPTLVQNLAKVGDTLSNGLEVDRKALELLVKESYGLLAIA